MKIKLNILIITIITIVIATGVFVVLRKDQKPSIIPSQNGDVQLPENTFNASTTVPGTRVIFSYPAKGFYGLGTDIVTNDAEQSVVVQTAAPYITEKGSEHVVLTVTAKKLPTDQKSLEDVIGAIDPNSYIGQYVKMNGEYRTIGGQDFFLSKMTEDVTVWSASTINEKNVISIILAYKNQEGAESQAAYQNNDRLFLQILEHISFK